MRQVAPLAAGFRLVEDRIPDLAPGILARAAGAALFGFGHHRLQDFPLVVGQIAGVGWSFHSEILSQFLTLSTTSQQQENLEMAITSKKPSAQQNPPA
jgi:hypothetical protein